MYPELNYTMNIVKYPFSFFPMDFMGCFHILGNNTNNKGKKNGKRLVVPLEHVVHPEGNVAEGKQNEVSGTLGAPSAS
jgi:hypothetical protein